MTRFVAILSILMLLPGIAAVMASDLADSQSDSVLTLFDCDFGEGWDNNFNLWPDHWTRASGIHFPQFIKAEIHRSAKDKDDPLSLTVYLNGGAFAAFSPPVAASNHYGYEMAVDVSLSGVTNDRAQVSLQFLDKEHHVIQEVLSDPVKDTKGQWRRIKIGPVQPNSQKIAWVRVGLATLPGMPSDLSGQIRFAHVWIGRLPRLDLKVVKSDDASEFGIFEQGKTITVDCIASGFKSARPTVRFDLEDIDGQVVQSEKVRTKVSPNSDPNQRLGTARWRFKPPSAGYYRIGASLDNEKTLDCRGETSIAIIESFGWNSESEFGWSFPKGRENGSMKQLTGLLLQLSSGWVEYPFWYSESAGDKEIEQLLDFIEQLSMSGVKLVGLLSDPPSEVRESFGNSSLLSAAEVFTSDPKIWFPSLEAVLLRLGPRVPYWVLGSHKDDSFVDQDKLQACLASIMKRINGTGVDIMVGISWSWVAEECRWDPDQAGVPAFLSLTTNPPMTAQEIQDYARNVFAQTDKEIVPENGRYGARTNSERGGAFTASSTGMTGSSRYRKAGGPSVRVPYRVVLQPLDATLYPPKARAADLVQRMLAAKQGGASAILMSDPFDKEVGMLRPDGSPGELFLPWRTTALNFGGSSYLGSIQLPHGSHNQLFSRGADVVMAVWSDFPCQEALYLGEDVKIVDIWGRSRKPEMDGNKHVIPVDSTPVFVTGLNPMVAMVRMSVRFAKKKFPAVLDREYDNQFIFKNLFPGGITGKVRLHMPEEWEVQPEDIAIQLVQDEELQEPLNIRIPFGAQAGKNLVRIEFEVGSRKMYRFNAYRTLQVGSDDLWMEFFPVFDPEGNLTIIQRFVNQTNEPISFRCQLVVPDRQWSETQIGGAGRGAYEAKHVFPNAKTLIGKTVRVRAVESNGLQTLNYSFVIE